MIQLQDVQTRLLRLSFMNLPRKNLVPTCISSEMPNSASTGNSKDYNLGHAFSTLI